MTHDLPTDLLSTTHAAGLGFEDYVATDPKRAADWHAPARGHGPPASPHRRLSTACCRGAHGCKAGGRSCRVQGTGL